MFRGNFETANKTLMETLWEFLGVAGHANQNTVVE